MTIATATAFRPPAPQPHEKPLGLFGRIAALRRNPIELWAREHYESRVTVNRSGTRALVSDPAGIRRIFVDNAANYYKDDLQLRMLRPSPGNDLLTAEADDWRLQRRLLAPMFTPRQIAAFAPVMAEAAQQGVELLRRREDRHIDLLQEMARLAFEMLNHTLFSSGLGCDAGEFHRALTDYLNIYARMSLWDLTGLPPLLPRRGQRKGRAALAVLDKAVNETIDARRKLIAAGRTPPRDVLTLLLEARDPDTGHDISEAVLRANTGSFIGAGHENTANGLTWTLYLLSQSPYWRNRVETEAESEVDAGPLETLPDRLPVTKAVLEEALRLYPPASILTRKAIAADEIGGKLIQPGTMVTIAPFVLHRHRTLWDRPDEFDPTRFLPGIRNRIDRFAYIPFGIGPRVCIGMGFAQQESVVALAHLARAFRFELKPGHRVRPMHRISLRPHGGMPMIIHTR
ncbi:cytochrome P450 [Bradyrhizobium canariense]|uniref:cytochrome P450 n=1 Tax=Bradyrhizobium canariense TaxID=255045 RepID=UPI001B8A5C60|nr:cytochrome P450 [Bradyrhizobium canariense]MBR0955329.1 cytochrome P450 [Bradyrhizobium canariense]